MNVNRKIIIFNSKDSINGNLAPARPMGSIVSYISQSVWQAPLCVVNFLTTTARSLKRKADANLTDSDTKKRAHTTALQQIHKKLNENITGSSVKISENEKNNLINSLQKFDKEEIFSILNVLRSEITNFQQLQVVNFLFQSLVSNKEMVNQFWYLHNFEGINCCVDILKKKNKMSTSTYVMTNQELVNNTKNLLKNNNEIYIILADCKKYSHNSAIFIKKTDKGKWDVIISESIFISERNFEKYLKKYARIIEQIEVNSLYFFNKKRQIDIISCRTFCFYDIMYFYKEKESIFNNLEKIFHHEMYLKDFKVKVKIPVLLPGAIMRSTQSLREIENYKEDLNCNYYIKDDNLKNKFLEEVSINSEKYIQENESKKLQNIFIKKKQEKCIELVIHDTFNRYQNKFTKKI